MFNDIVEKIPSYGVDAKLNLPYVLSEEGAPGLSEKQRVAIALSCSLVLPHPLLKKAAQEAAQGQLSEEEQKGALSAASLMSANNIFYRALHQSGAEELQQRRVRLRMNALRSHNMEQADFELCCVAVSAIHGCEGCLKAHIHGALKAGASWDAVHSTIRLASVLHAVYKTLNYATLEVE